MPEVAFVMSDRQPYPVRELAQILRYELELQGVPCALRTGGFPQPRPGCVYVLLDPLGYLAAEGPRSLPCAEVLKRTVFLCTDRRAPVGGDNEVGLMRLAGAVFVLDQQSVVEMHRAGIPARLMRPGYSKSLDRFDPDVLRPIDVMFMGARSARRTRYLSRAARVLSRRNCLLQISEGAPSPAATSSYLAENRWPLLAQTKVLIDVHPDDEDARFDWRGALDAIHAGAVVVTEHSCAIAPLVAGEHLLVASADSLPFVVDALLRDESRLAALRAAAHERLSNWIPFALPVSVLRAAIVELVGEPVSPAAPLSGYGLTSMGDAAPASAPPPFRDLEMEAIRHDLADARRNAAESRRQLNALRQTVRTATARPRSVEVVHASPAWGALRAPRVTIITALHGDFERGVPTLDSVAHSRLRDLELIAVNGGTAGSSPALLTEWMAAHPRIAAMLVASVTKRGTGAARNVALDFARAPYCLLLDPGQELYPRCLDVLTGTLDAMPDASFVYPIQEVVGQPDAFVAAGGDYLMSFLGWDPGRLRQGNWIHPPALIRTNCLREMGAFATDPRLDGMEDYDLWCRIAERDRRGQLVPQELARRVESESSPSLLALRPSPGPATRALVERSPALLAGAFPEP